MPEATLADVTLYRKYPPSPPHREPRCWGRGTRWWGDGRTKPLYPRRWEQVRGLITHTPLCPKSPQNGGGRPGVCHPPAPPPPQNGRVCFPNEFIERRRRGGRGGTRGPSTCTTILFKNGGGGTRGGGVTTERQPLKKRGLGGKKKKETKNKTKNHKRLRAAGRPPREGGPR